MICPGCGEEVAMIERLAVHTEPHGERIEERWAHCPACGEDFDWGDVEACGGEVKG